MRSTAVKCAMPPILPTVRALLGADHGTEHASDLSQRLATIFSSSSFEAFLLEIVDAPVFSEDFAAAVAAENVVRAIAPLRILRAALNLPLRQLFAALSEVAGALDASPAQWSELADRVHAAHDVRDIRLAKYLIDRLPDAKYSSHYRRLAARMVERNPHAIYPTSTYRESEGHVFATNDRRSVDAVMTLRTSSSIRTVDRVLSIECLELRNIYRPLGRCVCVIDVNVEALYGDQIAAYFRVHDIVLEKLVYRATEEDKGLATVERMLGDFKRLGVARNEPVLIAGGGVLADTGGLACALYGRNTPYVMLATSIVSGIDAGPSPRTCSDGFGYKNLAGAYHPPVVCITDRHFFATLHEGWLRHGIAEIVKIAAVTNASLFGDLEKAGERLITTRFGTVGCAPGDAIDGLSQNIVAGALQSYIAAEYGNLYETHQCRPHAYGHTWSPGFEIEAGLLHGHAVAIDMGFSAYLGLRASFIDRTTFERILTLLGDFGLSLRHDILRDESVMWASHRKIIEKRGGNLVAPMPKLEIGRCGYFNELSRAELFSALDEYGEICEAFPRGGLGIEPLCSDVGLELFERADARRA